MSNVVLCDMDDSYGGWTLIHKRSYNGGIDFNKSYEHYINGFGSAVVGQDLWIGLKWLYFLTSYEDYQMKIDIETVRGNKYDIIYGVFRLVFAFCFHTFSK